MGYADMKIINEKTIETTFPPIDMELDQNELEVMP